MTAEISQEAIDRMVAFVRNLASSSSATPIFRQAAEIAALLPAPVDPDKAIMREIVDRHLSACSYGTDAMFMELLNRGRELAASK